MSFPPLEGVDWKNGYFIVSANAELSDAGDGFVGDSAVLPAGAVDRLIEAALAAFAGVEPACDAESIRNFYTTIDPAAYDLATRTAQVRPTWSSMRATATFMRFAAILVTR